MAVWTALDPAAADLAADTILIVLDDHVHTHGANSRGEKLLVLYLPLSFFVLVVSAVRSNGRRAAVLFAELGLDGSPMQPSDLERVLQHLDGKQRTLQMYLPAGPRLAVFGVGCALLPLVLVATTAFDELRAWACSGLAWAGLATLGYVVTIFLVSVAREEWLRFGCFGVVQELRWFRWSRRLAASAGHFLLRVSCEGTEYGPRPWKEPWKWRLECVPAGAAGLEVAEDDFAGGSAAVHLGHARAALDCLTWITGWSGEVVEVFEARPSVDTNSGG
jgi:hypothetical protein